MAQRALTKRIIPVHVLTASYRIAGTVKVSNSGLSGLLTDPTSQFMTIMDASLGRIHDPDFLVQRLPDIRLVKTRSTAPVLNDARILDLKGSPGLGMNMSIFFISPSRTQPMNMKGCLEWPGRFDFKALMSGGTWEYLPVFEGTVRSIMYPELEIKSEAMLVNRKHIATFTHA